MRKLRLFFIASLAFVVTALVAMHSPEASVLTLAIDWYQGFTGHLDGMALANAAALAGAPEAIKAAAESLRSQFKADLDSATGDLQRDLNKNLNDIVKDLEPRIKSGEDAGQGVADIKLKVDKMSQDNATFVDRIEKMVKDHADSLNAEIEKLTKGRGGMPTGEHAPANFGLGLASQVKELGIGSTDQGKVARFSFKNWPNQAQVQRMKDISVSGATVYEPHYVPGIIGPGERQLRVRDLLPTNRTSNNAVYFVSETSLTDNAAPQSALGAAKGESTFTLTVDNETVKTIAHFIQVPLQILDDIPALEDYTNSRMLYMLENEEEYQLLYGNDTGQNLNGLMTQATAFDTTLATELGVSPVTDLDRIRLAIAQVQVAEYPPSGILMHPYNWAGIELLKESTYGYIFVMPQGATQPRLWGLPVVPTTQMASPDFLVGAFSLAAAIWDRQQSSIAISTEDSDNFQKNMATIRAEKRMTLTVYRTASLVEGDFARTVT